MSKIVKYAHEIFLFRHDTNQLFLKYHSDKCNGKSEQFIEIKDALSLLDFKSPSWKNEVTSQQDVVLLLNPSQTNTISDLLNAFMKQQATTTKKRKAQTKTRTAKTKITKNVPAKKYLSFKMVLETILQEMKCTSWQQFSSDKKLFRTNNFYDLILYWAKDILWYKVTLKTNLPFMGFCYEISQGALIESDFNWLDILMQHLDKITSFGDVEKTIANVFVKKNLFS